MDCGTKNASVCTLPEIRKGQRVRVHSIDGEAVACQRLRELGFCEKAEVKVLTNHGPMICQVCGSKVGLSKQVASAILVEPFS
jgi:Fe2+ transport system protein FeoA